MRTGHIFTGWDVIVGATVNILTGVISGGTIYQSGLTHDDVADWPITENIVFRAMWEPIEELIEILFDSNGGVTPNRTVTIPDGNSVMGSVREGYVEWPSIPERPGYVFLGWYTAIDPVTNEGTGRRLHNATPVYYQHPQSFIISSNARLMGLQPIQAQGPQNPATLTVYARWIPMAPVTFDSNGAGAADVTINYPVGYDAYTAGWIRRDTAGRIYDAFGPHSMHSIPSAERANQVPLRFSQSLNHLAMGGMSGGNAWHHAVWNTEPDGTGYSFGRSTVVTGPMTVYATWTGIVTFNNNHNRFSNASNSVMRRQVISGQSVHSNNIMELMFGVGSSPEHQVWNTLHRNNSPYNSEILTTQAQMPLQNIMPCHDDAGWAAFQLPGFAFLGWYTHPVYRNPEYRFTADTIVTENIQVFAHWADAIVLNIGGAASHANGIAWLGVDDQGNPNTVRRLYGAEVTNPALSLSDQGIDVSLLVPPTWPGRTFWHWNTSPCGGGFAIDAHTPILDFFVLYAIWHVDVVFHPGAGVFASSIQNYPIGTPTYWHPVQVAGRPPSDTFNINNVTKENWRFHHWNEDPVPGSATGDPYLHSTPIYGLNTGRLNLHAQFAGRVTFDFNITGASYNSMTPPPSPIDILQNRTANGEQEGSITNPNFPDPALVTHPHYTFQGWNTEPDGTGTWFNETTVMTMGDITVYGIWRGNMFNLTVSNSPSGLTHIGQTGVLGGATTTNLDPVVGTHNVQSGRGVTLTAGTVAGYTFIGWYRGTTPPADFDNIPAGNLVTTNVYAFPMPAADVSYIALWRRNPIVGVTINATKRVEGADAPAFNFGFTLTQVVDNLGSAVSPNAITGTSTANTTGGADSFPFSFDLEGLVADTYFFRIEETTVDTRQGWTNDLEPRIVTVTLFGEGNEREATVTGWNNSQTFTNTFQTPTANVTINATKRVAGENAPDFEFGFTLTQVANAAGDAFEGTAITDTVMRNTTGAGNEDFNFTINGLVAGTYFFRIQETIYDATNPNWSNDTAERIVTVNVAGNPLTATVADWDSVFINTYTYVPATTTAPITTVPITTAPITTVPITTVPITTVPITTVPITTVPITTVPITTAPITTVPITTAPITTVPITTVPITTVPITTVPITTAPITTVPITTVPITTVPITTAPITTVPITTAPITTVPITTAPITTAPITTAPVTTAPVTTPHPTTPAQMIKTPNRMTASVGESINWTLTGFHNPTGEEVANFTIVDMPGLGLNFRSGLLPAFTNGAGVTYEIRYMRAGDTAWRVHATGINAANPHSFDLPQPGTLYYTAIGFYFGNVPADFALGSEIVLTFIVGANAPNNQLINNFMIGFDNIEQDGDSPYIPIVVTPTTPPVATTTPGGGTVTTTTAPGGGTTTTPGGIIQTFPPATSPATTVTTTSPPAATAAPTASNPTNTGTTNAPNVTPPFGPPGTGNRVPNGNGTGYFELDNQGAPRGEWVWNNNANRWDFIEINNPVVPRGAVTLGALPQTGIMDNILWLASALFVALSASLGTMTYMKAKKRKRGGNL